MGIVKDLARSPRPKGAAGATLEGLYLTLPQGRLSSLSKARFSRFSLRTNPSSGIDPADQPQEITRGHRPLDPHKR